MSSHPGPAYQIKTLGGEYDSAGRLGTAVDRAQDGLTICNLGNTVEVVLNDLQRYSGVLVKKTPALYRLAVKQGFPWYKVASVTIDRANVVSITKVSS